MYIMHMHNNIVLEKFTGYPSSIYSSIQLHIINTAMCVCVRVSIVARRIVRPTDTVYAKTTASAKVAVSKSFCYRPWSLRRVRVLAIYASVYSITATRRADPMTIVATAAANVYIECAP